MSLCPCLCGHLWKCGDFNIGLMLPFAPAGIVKAAAALGSAAVPRHEGGRESVGPLLFAQPGKTELGRLPVPCMSQVCSGWGHGSLAGGALSLQHLCGVLGMDRRN